MRNKINTSATYQEKRSITTTIGDRTPILSETKPPTNPPKIWPTSYSICIVTRNAV